MASPALPAFDKGDVILRSSDNKDFLMYKLDLSRASPVFETMFSLPQPRQDDAKDGLPVIELTETGEVLGPLFALCMPMRRTSRYFESSDVASVTHTLQAAKKYEMGWRVEEVRDRLKEQMEQEPIRGYVLVCRLGLKEETELAARFCLRIPMQRLLDDQAEELSLLTFNQFRRLAKYREDCREAIERYLSRSFPRLFYLSCGYAHCQYEQAIQDSFNREYSAQLLVKLKGCAWEGAVRVEDALKLFHELSWETKCNRTRRCTSDILEQVIPQGCQKIAVEIATILEEITSSTWRDP